MKIINVLNRTHNVYFMKFRHVLAPKEAVLDQQKDTVHATPENVHYMQLIIGKNNAQSTIARHLRVNDMNGYHT